jgi:hypothetical protein
MCLLLILLCTTLPSGSISAKWEHFFEDAVLHFDVHHPMILLPPGEQTPFDIMTKIHTYFAIYEPGINVETIAEHVLNMYAGDKLDMLFFLGEDPNPLLKHLNEKLKSIFSKVIVFIPFWVETKVDIKLRFDSNIYIYQDFDQGLQLYETYAVKDKPPVQLHIGSWTEEWGITVSSRFIWERRTNLFGINLRNIVLPFSFISIPVYDNENNIVSISGFFIDILTILGQKHNFTFTSSSPADKKWGAIEADGSWNGMIGMLTRDEGDLVTSGPTQTLERSLVSDMSVPLLPDMCTLITAVSKGVQTQLWVYTDIFPMASWYALGGLVFLTGFAFVIIDSSGKKTDTSQCILIHSQISAEVICI